MMQEVYEALESRDIVHPDGGCFARHSDPPEAGEEAIPPRGARCRRESDEDAFVLQLIQKLDCPVFLIINKIDLVLRSKLLPLIERFSAMHPFAEVIPISAQQERWSGYVAGEAG